jgi:hypothetical protein
MNAQPLSDARIAAALRAHLPTSAQPGLHRRVSEAVEVTSQQRPLPSFLGALSDADPIGSQRNLLIAAALLLGLAVASAASVGAWRLLQPDMLPRPYVPPRNIEDVPGEFSFLEPGTYYVEPVSIPVRVLYTIPGDGWRSWIGTFKPEEGHGAYYRHVGMSIVNVTNLVVDGCTNHSAADPPVGPTVNDLATALAALPPFVVATRPRDVTIYGYRGKYMEITLPQLPRAVRGEASTFPDCAGFQLKSWIGPPVSDGFWGYWGPGEHEEFWILDVEGSRLVIEASWSPESPAEDVAELRTILESITIEPAS